MQNGFTEVKVKDLLREVKELMEIVSVNERVKNQRLMSRYVFLFAMSLPQFNAEEVWRS